MRVSRVEGVRGLVVLVALVTLLVGCQTSQEAQKGQDAHQSQGAQKVQDAQQGEEGAMQEPKVKTPWRVSYSDFSANRFSFSQTSPDKAAKVIYDPVTPMESSSGTYSGGSWKETTLDEATVARLWELVEEMASATDQHADRRRKMTGSFRVSVEGGVGRHFLMNSGDLLREFNAFVEPFRGPVVEPRLEKFQGIARNAKMGAVLETSDEVIWLSLSEWPDETVGKTVVVEGHYQAQRDLPVFIEREGAPRSAGIPVPPGTDLEKAATRRVLQVSDWVTITDP